MKIAILTTSNQWFVPYAKKLQTNIPDSTLYFHHEDIPQNIDIIFILSYHSIIPKEILLQHQHNIVIHASDLPKGKGWAPMFWQILEGKNTIYFTMFEASDGVDNGDVYMKRTLELTGYELNEELRKKQACFIIEMCIEFIQNYPQYKLPMPQQGKESFYVKRCAKDSRLDIDKSLREQFNLLRIVDNESYPAFFDIDGHTYKITIEHMETSNETR